MVHLWPKLTTQQFYHPKESPKQYASFRFSGYQWFLVLLVIGNFPPQFGFSHLFSWGFGQLG
jgi:hypothetical protein